MNNMETVLFPPDRQDDFTDWLRDECGYIGTKRLDDGSYAAIMPLITTIAIAFDVDKTGYGARYCFEDTATCLAELEQITCRTYVPKGWIAKR